MKRRSPPSDLDRLQGTWFVSTLQAGARIVIDGNCFRSLGMGAEYEGLVTLSERKPPKTIDLLMTSGHAKGTCNLGIYKLTRDGWTMCLALNGPKRPSAFRAKAGVVLQSFQRKAPARSASKTSPPAQTPRPVVGSGTPTPLEGEWAMAAAVFNGAAMNDDMVRWCQRVTVGDVTTVLAGPNVMLRARFTLSAATRPASIDYVNIEGKDKGKAQAGIFELTGDTLRICMAPPKKPRPSEFASTSGDGRSLTEWTRGPAVSSGTSGRRRPSR